MLRIATVFAALASLAAAANAQSTLEPRAPASRAEMQLSFSQTVKKAAPSVVNVYALKRATRQNNPFMEDEFFKRFFGGAPSQGGMPMERVQRSLGSGVIVDASGLIITNNHVIEGADEIRIALADRRELSADVVLRDPRSDLAVLRIKDAREKFLAIEIGNSDEVEVGDLVLAIGDPFGVGQTVTQGIVSATARTRVGITDYQFFIQTDAAINPGNSGGALVDINGRLVGINTAIFSRSGGSHGIGFAIPVNMVQFVVASARTGGKTVRRPYFGARVQAITNEIAESLNLKRPVGALVSSVVPDGPAARAGLRAGDLIIAIDDQTIDDPSALNYRFAIKPIGGVANLQVERGGKMVAVAIKLEAAPERKGDEVEIRAKSPFSGARVSNITPALADELRFDQTAEGVVIVNVASGSTAQNVGFRAGDIVLQVNGARIETTGDLERAVGREARVWNVTISRGGQQRSVTLRG